MTDKIDTIAKGVIGAGAIEGTGTLAQIVSSTDTMETIFKLALQILVALVTILQIIKKDKK
jgi:hypothetical protein